MPLTTAWENPRAPSRSGTWTATGTVTSPLRKARAAQYVSVLLNAGDGTFAADVTYGPHGGSSVAIGDLDGDEDLESPTAKTLSGLLPHTAFRSLVVCESMSAPPESS